MTETQQGWVLVALAAVVPLATVVVVALLRGYTIDLHMSRNGGPGWRMRWPRTDDERNPE